MSHDPPRPHHSQPSPLVSLPGRVAVARLPSPLAPFVGRSRELAACVALLRDRNARLVTLTGPGGVGKTRLALQVAAELATDFADGADFVELSAIHDPSLVAPAIARALGIRRFNDEPAIVALKRALNSRDQLLVLDNFEQVVAAAPTLSELLEACPNVTTIVTSRAVLRLSGERIMPVLPLEVHAEPTEGLRPGVAEVATIEAVRLFVERSQAASPGFELTEHNAPAVTEICARLDGLPLAIELAAARAPLYSPAGLLERLQPRLPLLTAGARDLPSRQQTMRDTIRWSYELLSAAERAAFRRLAVFVGGCTVEAAERVCEEVASVEGGGDRVHAPPEDVSAVLDSLSGQSLIQISTTAPDGTPRLTMLETVREFAAQELLDSGDDVGARRKHAACYLNLVLRAERAYWGDAPGDQSSMLDAELGNLRAALAWAAEHSETDTALRLASAVFDPFWIFDPLWQISNNARELRAWTRRALAMPGGSAPNRVAALVSAACLAEAREDTVEARALVDEAIGLARDHGDGLGLATASFVRGRAAYREGDLATSRRFMSDALTGFRAQHAQGREAWALCFLASLDSRDAIDEGGDRRTLASATLRCEDALKTFEAAGYYPGIVRARHGLAYIAYKLRDLPRALALTQELLAQEWQRQRLVNNYLNDIAEIAGRAGQFELAGRLYGAADKQRARHGEPLPPVYRSEFDRDRELVREELGSAAFTVAWEAGHHMPVDRAVEEALGFALPASDTAGVRLTPREREILPLLAAGRTDREIGAILFLSHRTVENHVARLRAKLGVRTRAEAIRTARLSGLLPISPSEAQGSRQPGTE
jgi:predicted ATPase/DNA-binding CsgD family transcriptional regulator